MKKKELLEKLAELEHEQWMMWATDIYKKEQLSGTRQRRWLELFVPYRDLTEKQKDQDRKWAKKVLALLVK